MFKLKEFRISKNNIIQKERITKLCLKNNFLIINYNNRNINKINSQKIFFEMGDVSFDENFLKKVRDNKVILSTNNEINKENIFSVPIGVTNTSHCKIIGNLDVIVEQFNKEKNYNKKLVYMNFNNHPGCNWYRAGKERKLLCENLKIKIL